MGQRVRSKKITTRHPAVIKAALGVTALWLGFGIGFFIKIRFGGGLNGGSDLAYLLPLSLLIVLIWVMAVRIARAQQATANTLEQLQGLAPHVFEAWVAARLRDLGYSIKTTDTQVDHAIDLVAEKSGELAIVQCKRYTSSFVSEGVLRDLFRAMQDFGATSAYLVTTGKLTRTARKWVAGKPIEVWDGDHLARTSLRLARKNGAPIEVQTIIKTPTLEERRAIALSLAQGHSWPGQHPQGRCPKCGLALVQKSNRFTGKAFLACPAFPNCRYTEGLPQPAEPVDRQQNQLAGIGAKRASV